MSIEIHRLNCAIGWCRHEFSPGYRGHRICGVYAIGYSRFQVTFWRRPARVWTAEVDDEER